MNFVTQNNIYSKCYLNLFEIVPQRMGSISLLAVAIANFKSILEKNINYKCYSSFSNIISKGLFSPLAWKDHFILSPFFRSSILIASLGIIVLNVDAFGFGESTFVNISITFIHLLFCFLSLLNGCKTFYKYFPIVLLKFGKYFPKHLYTMLNYY